MKKCTTCKIEKELNEFHKQKTGKFGVRANCKECRKEYNKKYHIEHKKILKQKNKEYRELHLEHYKEYMKNYREKLENKIRRNKQQKRQHNININVKIAKNSRNRIYDALKNNTKGKRTLELLGCTVEYLKQYLQSQFIEDMSWDNYGLHGWHIDHIKPCSLFDMTDPKQQELCFNYKNLQPLWAEDNYKKGSKILKDVK